MSGLLQFDALDRAAEERLRASGSLELAARARTGLEDAADDAIAALRVQRELLARQAGGFLRLRECLDRVLRTDAVEYFDRADQLQALKVQEANSLHRFNRMTLAYGRYVRAIEPLIRRITEREGRPARFLELASGSGEFPLSLSTVARRYGLPVEVTGSDIVPGLVDRARVRAKERSLPVSFRVLDACKLEGVGRGEYDLVFIAQSTHHFTAGRLARMIRATLDVAPDGFVAIDGYRGPLLLGFVNAITWTLMDRYLTHDAWVSVRSLWSQSELGLIARIAAPEAAIEVRSIPLGYSMLVVRHPSPEPLTKSSSRPKIEKRRGWSTISSHHSKV